MLGIARKNARRASFRHALPLFLIALRGWASWSNWRKSIPWKSMGVHPKSGRIVRDIKYLKTANRLHTLMGSGAGSRIRTDDRLITNQVLYQLSYTGDSAQKIS
jgi:hypothetical protein